MHQHAREATCATCHLYFTTGPLDPKNKLAKQNNPFNNWRTDVFFHRALQLIFDKCCDTSAKITKHPFSIFTHFVIFFSFSVVLKTIVYQREELVTGFAGYATLNVHLCYTVS